MQSCTIPDFLADESAIGIVQPNRPLASLTHYGLGGTAEWFVRPQRLSQLIEIVSRCRRENVPCRVLGGGANLLVDDDGVDGVVVHLEAPCFTHVAWDVASRASQKDQTPREDSEAPAGGQRSVFVSAGAGADMMKLVSASVKRGLSGLECLAGIPGTVGGCVRMNAGGRWGDISKSVRKVAVIDSAGELRVLTPAEVGFGYRHTNLKHAIVCSALFELTTDDPQVVERRYREIWAAKKAAQPLAAHSAGCVFKNPPGDSAGRLIDAAGLKNRTLGSASVSEAHANFIVAGRDGRSRDVLDLIDVVQKTVADRFAVNLELEVEVWRRARETTSVASGVSARAESWNQESESSMSRLAHQASSSIPATPVTQRGLAITVLSGGPSSEREVSLMSGQAIARALNELGHKATIADISPANLTALDIPADMAFIALHGAFGEDGRVQQLLDERKIRYTGSGAAASALAMDKVATKCRFVEAEVPTPRFDVVTADRIGRAVEVWPLPAVIKPIGEGSSIDIQIVHDAGQLREVLQRLTRQYGKCMVEKFVDGHELTVGILGDMALPPIEIRTKREFYNYEAKYIDNDTEYRFDIDLPAAVLAEVRALSVRAHQALGCRHFSRVDWLVDRQTHQPYALEVNTIPGFTDHSLLPKSAARIGLSFGQLCQRIVDLACSHDE